MQPTINITGLTSLSTRLRDLMFNTSFNTDFLLVCFICLKKADDTLKIKKDLFQPQSVNSALQVKVWFSRSWSHLSTIYGQKSSIKRLFQPTLGPISALGTKSAIGNWDRISPDLREPNETQNGAVSRILSMFWFTCRLVTLKFCTELSPSPFFPSQCYLFNDPATHNGQTAGWILVPHIRIR